jgi:hypothetical protein
MTSGAFTFDYHFGDGFSTEDIPFELNANKPYMQVSVDGAMSGWFILDTGSVSIVVDTELATALGLQAGASFQSTGAGEGSLPGATGEEVAFTLEGLAFTASPVDILPINKAISFSEGRRIDGLLGYDFFAHFVVMIDYANERIAVHDPRAFTEGGMVTGAALALEIVRGHPFLTAELTTAAGAHLTGQFLVDTGWRSVLSLNAPFVAQHDLLGATPTIEAITGVGIGGPTLEPVGRIATLQLGPFAIPHPITNFSTAKVGILAETNMAGIIGGDLLRRFTVIFDYPGKQMLLAPNARFADPYEFDMAGMMVTAEGDNLHTFRIYRVLADSPAEAAGLRADDVIAAIDGQPAAALSLEHIRRLFRQEARTAHALEIRREAQRLNVILQLRRLI